MRKIIFSIMTGMLMISAVFMSYGQIIKPIEWSQETSVSSVEINGELELVFRAVIDDNWYLYSSDFDPDLGPMITEFEFKPNDSYALIGDIQPVGQQKKYDEIWEGEITFFKKTGEFRQKIKILKQDPVIAGSYSYQVCSDIDGKCIPFDEDFVFDDIRVTAGDDVEVGAANGNIQAVKTGDLFGSQEAEGILQPAAWETGMSDPNPSKGDEIELIFKAAIDRDWILYSSDFTLDPGPVRATFRFEPNSTYQLIGQVVPVGAKKKFDEIFEGEVTYFKDAAEFRQRVKILEGGFSAAGILEYQVCSDIDGKCINFEEDFVFGKATGEDPGPGVAQSSDGKDRGLLASRDSYSPYSLLAFMIVAFMGGLAALFTPCVFPMIPMTVTFFTGRSKNRRQGIRNAFIYGFSIIFIYTLIGSLVAPFMGPEMANELATNWIPNVFFFIIFLVFALSFFGLFEITLPNAWVNKVDKQADKGGLAGIFFMAFTLVLVSFSCTGPIVGSILVESAGGQIIKPIMGMLAFSLAFAIPFTLFAVFPEWLNSLPKSGGWLNAVKVVLGFIELAFSLKFLSIADQAYHWGILDREVYLAAWIVIFSLLGMYFLGKIRLPGDSKMEVLGVPRLILAIVTFTFVVYLIPGMFGAPLKSLAGYLPPMSTLDFNLSMNAAGLSYQTSGDQDKTVCGKPEFADILHMPHNLQGYFDYEQALACARELNKPIFIDFTGHGCVNCREMEARVWSDPEVLSRLRDDYVLLALYVDDKTELPESDWYTSEYDGKVKKTIGKQNADLQIRKFRNNAQPFYILMDPKTEMPLVSPRAYDLDIGEFVTFLDSGKAVFDK
jgi:thiol:disulfide interchange protein DsbD